MRRLAFVVAALSLGCAGSEPGPGEPLEAALRADGLDRAERAGAQLFRARCATCHGETGRGDGQNAYTLQPAPPDFRETLPRTDPGYWRRIVEGGTLAVGRSPLCPPWGRNLAEHEVEALVAYLGLLARPGDAATADAAGP